MKLHPIFHISKLAKYNLPEPKSLQSTISRPPPVDVIDEDDVYVIDRIIDHCFCGRKKTKQYLCKWEGYDMSDNTWEDASNILEDAPDVVTAYETHRQ